MKFLKNLLALVLLTCFATSAAAKNEKMNWFFKSRGDNSQPEVLGGNPLIEKYDCLYMGEKGDKTIYLTFDAGYSNENVEKILDVLKKHNITGAFFILPGIIEHSPETVKRMANEGHLVCNHSTSHGDMSAITDIAKFQRELTGVEQLYKELTGCDMAKYFRPPEGAFSENTLKFCEELGYIPVFWSFAYADWDDKHQTSAEKAGLKILDNAHDGMVMLLHPTSATNAAILDDVICRLKAQGYDFGSLDELAEKQGL